jgi:cytochrome oxidase Cu insertion factor (SCO1/SenC/PrrC family)
MFALVISTMGLLSAMAVEVKIDSFDYIGNSRLAELCGHIVDGPNSVQPITITVDPKSNRPAEYVAHTSAKGKFCTVVVTYTGTAQAASSNGESSLLANVRSTGIRRGD